MVRSLKDSKFLVTLKDGYFAATSVSFMAHSNEPTIETKYTAHMFRYLLTANSQNEKCDSQLTIGSILNETWICKYILTLMPLKGIIWPHLHGGPTLPT